MSSFRPAARQQLKLRMALAGPSGSGKTITALRIAQGLGPRIAVIDTENRSASRYIGEDFGEGPLHFDVVELEEFQPQRLVKLLNEAAEAGYDVVVVDSLSHFWMGEGGMLDAVDAAAKRNNGGNSFAAWKAVKPAEREMWDALIRCKTHLICTLRTKTDWVIEENDRGKKTPRKIGLKAEQRDGLEYEFDVVGDMDIEHSFYASKTRCSALDGRPFQKPGANIAKILRGWLDAGDAAPPQEERQRPQQREERREEPRQEQQRPQERREVDASRTGGKTTTFSAILERFRAIDPGWTNEAIAEALGIRDVFQANPERLIELGKLAAAGTAKPGSKPTPNQGGKAARREAP